MLTQHTPTDRQARISADIILLILLAFAFGPALSAIRLPTHAAAEVRPTVAPAIIIVATPALPTPRPTEVQAVAVQAAPPTPVVIVQYVEVTPLPDHAGMETVNGVNFGATVNDQPLPDSQKVFIDPAGQPTAAPSNYCPRCGWHK